MRYFESGIGVNRESMFGYDGSDYYVCNVNSDGKLRVISDPYLYQIAEGNISGHSAWSKTGYNADVDAGGTGIEDLWTVGGTFAFPPSAMQMEVVSDAAGDDAGSTGVTSVIITYLDSTYTEKTEVVVTDGTNAVATVATDILRVNNFRAYTVGANKVAAGNIDIRETDNAPVYSRIAVGGTRARNAAYTVPLGKTLYITSAKFSAVGSATGKDAIFTARATYDDKRGAILDFFMPFIEWGVQDGGQPLPFEMPIKLPATVDIKVAVFVGNDNTFCSSIMRGWIE